MTISHSFVIRGKAGKTELRQPILPPLIPGLPYSLTIESIVIENVKKPTKKLIFISCRNVRNIYNFDDSHKDMPMPLHMLLFKPNMGQNEIWRFPPRPFKITNLKPDLIFNISVLKDAKTKILEDARITIHFTVSRDLQ